MKQKVSNGMKPECKKLINKGVCGKDLIWNPSNYECDVINHEILVSTQIMKIVNARKGW